MERYWFRPRHKKYSYGPGTPISWEGWAVYLLFIAAMGLLLFAITYFGSAIAVAIFLVGIAILVTAFGVVLRIKTEPNPRFPWSKS